MLEFVRVASGAVAIFLLPGSALLALARRRLDLDPVESLCMALGLSLAAIPLFLYITTLLNVAQGPWLVLLLLVLCAGITVWDCHDWRVSFRPIEPAAYLLYGALAMVFFFTLLGRLWSVAGINFPLWTDSYGHTVITQLIVEKGMIPTTYEPYAPIEDFTYHFGFHGLSAWFHWVTGATVPQSLVMVGQILNALVVPTTYIFVQRLFNRRSTGLAAAVIVGALSHMPAQYVNWGRYTQLDGLILLPVAIALYLAVLRTLNPHWRVLLLTALAFVGLFFDHYRIVVFGVLLVIILFGFAYLWPKQWGQERGRLLVNSVLIAITGLVILSPWLWRLAEGFGGNYARSVVVGGYQPAVHGDYFDFTAANLTDFGVHLYLWVLAALAALWGLWRRQQMVMTLLLWIIAIFAGANLHLIHITPLYSNTIVILALYLPLAALCAYFVTEVMDWLATKLDIRDERSNYRSRTWASGLIAILFLFSIYGVWRDIKLVAPDNSFVRPNDLIAMQWVRQEIPQNALFYVATYFWTPTVAHGLEAGYYLPLLAGRQTIIPLENYASDGAMEYRTLVNQRLRDLAAAPDTHALAETMRAYGITHIYVGERQTTVNPQNFVDDPVDFELLYDKGNVWIFAVRAAAPS